MPDFYLDLKRETLSEQRMWVQANAIADRKIISSSVSFRKKQVSPPTVHFHSFFTSPSLPFLIGVERTRIALNAHNIR